VANLGFVERENAAILNASILTFARRTIRSFEAPIKKLGLNCPVFITQNDGTVLSGETAAKLPIRTFSSGPTNSMRGAAFLVGQTEEAEDMMVVDIGGTTSDVGLLLKSGFPRQQAAYSDLAGVRVNFPSPDIKSIGLGGGSLVRLGRHQSGGTMTVGPDSVGYKLSEEAVVFGGKTLTTTDCAVLANPELRIGNGALVRDKLSSEQAKEFQDVVKKKLETIIDTMKTSPADLPVILVGGGAIIAPDHLLGASRVVKPQYAEVANAIGAAIARVSAVVDTVQSTESKSSKQLVEEMCVQAVEKTVAAGARRETVKVVEVETLPLQYTSNKTRVIVRAAGECDFERTVDVSPPPDEEGGAVVSEHERSPSSSTTKGGVRKEKKAGEVVDVSTYKPTVKDRVWYLNETDVYWISIGKD
jgi:N-methylhydantoinase A/oxoprolinase/acetone carboxylase beta subunit